MEIVAAGGVDRRAENRGAGDVIETVEACRTIVELATFCPAALLGIARARLPRSRVEHLWHSMLICSKRYKGVL